MAILDRPFTSFNYQVRLILDGSAEPLCDAAFSDCDGLEISMETKTIREGGSNQRQIHLVGPLSYGQLTLKRGMTDDAGLWDWFEQVQRERTLRATGEVILLSSDRARETLRFVLGGCLPIKLKAPMLSASDGGIAVEEMQIAYETLRRAPRTGG
jgi:phage tail-like protein